MALMAILVATASASSAAPGVTTLYPGYNQALNVLVPGGNSTGGTVHFLGNQVKSTAQCQAACESYAQRCWSFVYFPAAAPSPAPDPKVTGYKIRVRRSHLQLQADDLADGFISTRYQRDDGFSRFLLEPVHAGDNSTVRVRVLSDKKMVGANDGGAGGTKDWPAHVLSTKSQKDGATSHFVLESVDGKAFAIRTMADPPRYWDVEPLGHPRGGIFTSPAKPGGPTAQTQFTIEPADGKPGGGHDIDGGRPGECYGLTSPGFNPSYDPNAVSGVVEWPCRTDDDCSLNGKCGSGGECQCRPAWKGKRCEQLNLLAPTRGAGYRGVDNGHNTSSWGGAVLKGPDGTYHMWAAEMTEHCGIGTWQQNSRVIHATSATPGGAYTRKDVTWEVFSHEPEVVPGPNGEFIMYFTAQLRSEHGDCNCCRPGHGPCDGSTGTGDCRAATGASGQNATSSEAGPSGSFMSWTTDPNGNWSTPQKLFGNYRGSDTNFAPLILKNGSIVGMWRRWGGGKGGSRQFLATATDWKDMSTYVQHQTELFPDLGAAGTEDQFVYADDDGYYHAVFHHMYGTGTKTQWWLDATGGHAFSRDGWTWTYTGVAWGNATARYNTPAGQGAKITFTDGLTTKFTRLERPHLVFKTNQMVGDPIFLTNSAQYGDSTNPEGASGNGDACYTLLRPVNQKP